VQTISDPRSFPIAPAPADVAGAHWHEWVESSFAAATGLESAAANARLHQAMVDALASREAGVVRAALDAAPTAVAYRHLLRALHGAWLDPALDRDAAVVAHGFAIPVVIVAAAESAIEVPMVLDDAQPIVALLREHRCLAANENFALANVLAGNEAVGLPALARWLEWRTGADPDRSLLRDVEPAALRVSVAQEGAHLRFLVGAAWAARGASLFVNDSVGAWATPLAQLLIRQLAAPGLQILALPRAPADPLVAAQRGQVAHREIALQLFAASAIRTLRANFGEPTAVVSAHRIESHGATNGELRLSLSSVFGERDAEGFRCPLFPYDRIEDVLAMIVDLLRECRIADIRIMQGVHPDRVATTGAPLLFRADAIGAGDAVSWH